MHETASDWQERGESNLQQIISLTDVSGINLLQPFTSPDTLVYLGYSGDVSIRCAFSRLLFLL